MARADLGIAARDGLGCGLLAFNEAVVHDSARTKPATAMKPYHIVVIAAFSAPGLAQDAPPSAPQVVGDEEVIVRGRTPEELRLEIERTEDAVYARFNELNSSDDFDILCSEQAPTGSNIPVRTCKPNFVLRAEQRAAGASLHRMQGGAYGLPPNERVYLQRKGEELTAEIERVAREDEQLMTALTRLFALNELQHASREPPAEAPSAPAIE